MSLQKISDQKAFGPPLGDSDRIGVYVVSHELGVERAHQPEPRLMRILRAERARVQVQGPTGSGKTSLITRTIAHLVRMGPSNEDHLVVRLEVAYDPSSYEDGTTLIKAIVDGVIAAVGKAQRDPSDRPRPLLSGLDLGDLRLVAADSTTETPRKTSSTVGIQAGTPAVRASFSQQVEAATLTWTTDTTPQSRRNALIEILQSASGAGIRVLIVVDDTDHFATDEDGRMNVRRLYQALHNLDELDVGILVGYHPRFDDDEDVHRIVTDMGMERVAVASLPPTADCGIATILDGHLEHHGIETKSRDIFDDEGLGILEGLYYEYEQDYRRCLRVAHWAATEACAHGETTIPAQYVKRAVVATRRTGAQRSPECVF